MSDPIPTQDSNLVPPERGATFPIEITSTAKCYDLAALFADQAPFTNGGTRTAFVTMAPVGAAVFYHFRPDYSASPDLDDTAKITAGGGTSGALVATNTYGKQLPDGSSIDHHIRVPRNRYLVLKCASGASGILFLTLSSNEAGPA